MVTITKLKKRLCKLPPLKQLAISFILNWFFWLITRLLADQFIFDEKRSWKSHFFHATWMSFFMTIPFNWKELKQIFTIRKEKIAFSEDKKNLNQP